MFLSVCLITEYKWYTNNPILLQKNLESGRLHAQKQGQSESSFFFLPLCWQSLLPVSTKKTPIKSVGCALKKQSHLKTVFVTTIGSQFHAWSVKTSQQLHANRVLDVIWKDNRFCSSQRELNQVMQSCCF